MEKNIEQLSIDTIRSLCIDETNAANSGHPGMALGSAPILYTLFSKHLIANCYESKWINRDRFVLSAGHASSLLYAMLHLCGYKISIDDLKHFRQLNSVTPGHPEYMFTDGVDATSGPLGQGIAQAVGLALGESLLQNTYPEGEKLINHYTYVLCGDGCLQEGVSQEAISLAGHLKLNKLIMFYDSNDVTLDGPLSMSFSENVKERFISCNWEVIEVNDGNDVKSIDQAIIKAKKSKEKPVLIIVKTVIGYGSSKQGTNKVHGSPLGMEDGINTKKNSYQFDYPDFYVPEQVKNHFKDTFIKRGTYAYDLYLKELNTYKAKYPDKYNYFVNSIDSTKYINQIQNFDDFNVSSENSTRAASGKALNYYMKNMLNLFGGSADVASSVMTKLDEGSSYSNENKIGHNINWGIREFAMASAQNGLLLHGGIKSYVGCFCVFSDYMKPAIRMASLSHLPAIYLFSHDSVALGEDGPTHQPVEQLAMLRSIPNLRVIRPCDERETFAAWKIALESQFEPTALILSRQKMKFVPNSSYDGVNKGGYIISKEENKADFILIATGSEVNLALSAKEKLKKYNLDIRVVSLPCWELFDSQDEKYQNEILNLSIEKRISVEMLSSFGWDKYAKHHFSIDTFGCSAPIKDVILYFNFTDDDLVNFVLKINKEQ